MSEPSEWARERAVALGRDGYLPGDLRPSRTITTTDIASALDAARAEGAAEERARIVAWLRSDEPAKAWACSYGGSEYTIAATCIERNEHAAERGEEET